jgi:hypothetical protein
MVCAGMLASFLATSLGAQLVTDSGTKADVHAMKVATIFRTPERKPEGNYDSETPGFQEIQIQHYVTLAGDASKVGYVIPVPAEPRGIAVIEDAEIDAISYFHADTLQMARTQWTDRTQWVMPGDDDEPAAKPQPMSAKGDIDAVTSTTTKAIKTAGPTALRSIRSFFQSQNLTPPAENSLRWHLKNDWRFVCVVHESSKMSGQLALPVILVSFDAYKAYVPTTNLTQSADTLFEIAIISDNPLREQDLERGRLMFGEKTVGRVVLKNLWRRKNLPESVTSRFSSRATNEKHDRWLLNLIRGTGFKHGDEFAHNFGISGGIVTDEIPGFWYYGDDEPGWFEGFFRKHGLAVMLSLAGLFLFFIISKMIKDARKKSAATDN